jgi:hypothetical protein
MTPRGGTVSLELKYQSNNSIRAAPVIASRSLLASGRLKKVSMLRNCPRIARNEILRGTIQMREFHMRGKNSGGTLKSKRNRKAPNRDPESSPK